MMSIKMSFTPNIQIGERIDNGQLCSIFGCAPQGGMRRSKKTNSLVLVSNHVTSIYDDRWINGDLHYTGMGQKGDQSINSSQNRTLAESAENRINIFLFEVFKEKEYSFSGRVRLASSPYQETQSDESGIERLVWIFPLTIVDPALKFQDRANIETPYLHKEKIAKKLTDQELLTRAKKSHEHSGFRQVSSIQYERSPWVAVYCKRRANGVCDLCNLPAPFKTKEGEPYLECHHIEWLANGGADSIDNAAALCPNCHRKMHSLNLATDRDYLKKKNINRN